MMDLDPERILLLVKEQDMRKRMESGQKLIEYLNNIEGDIRWDHIDQIIDSLASLWVSSSNFKIALLGLDILSLLVERMQEDFQHYFILVQLALVDRLGDQKDQVRDASITLLTNIMEVSITPQYAFERLVSNFTHKVWRVRAGLCILLVATINRFGSKSLLLSRLLPHICNLLADSNGQVRENAVLTLVEIYRHVGERVRNDIQKYKIAPNRLNQVYAKFDAVQKSGEMVSDTASVVSTTSSFESMETSTPMYSETSTSPKTNVNNNNERMSVGPARVSNSSRPSTGLKRPNKKLVPSAGRPATAAGAMDGEMFKQSMVENLPKVYINSPRDLEELCNNVYSIISNEKKDWEERCKALKTVRAIIVEGGAEYDSFYQFLRIMEPALRLNAKDLRSQVVRESCLTIGLLSSNLRNRFDHAAEFLLPTLFNLVPNSAKIMATSGIVTIQYILKHTHSPRLVPLLVGNTTSKSTVVRRKAYVFVDLILQEWNTHLLEKHATSLVNSVKSGISDADAEARVEARKAWWGLHTHFPVEADNLFGQLTAGQQKMIKGQLSASSSTDSLPKSVSSESSARPTSRLAMRPPVSKAPKTPSQNKFLRSRSDIDPNAARRSRTKAQSSGYATVGPRRVRGSAAAPPNRGRDADRPSISQRSQSATRYAGSRSNSPNSQRGYRRSNIGYKQRPTGRASQSSNREESPPRAQGRTSTSSVGRAGRIPPMRVLPRGREGEQALSDALMSIKKTASRRGEMHYGYSDNDDDFSDTSSVCSDRSSNYHRTNGRKRTSNHHTEDIAEVLTMCQSSNWAERKEGLASLQVLVSRQKSFTPMELKKVLEVFNQMFADPHGKVFSLFLEILPDFVNVYKHDILSWLYMLLTQLLKKMGADLLGSVQGKVLKALECTRISFPPDQQFHILTRYIVDQTQTPNLKVKVALLHYLVELTVLMVPGDVTSSSETRLAISRIITWTTEPKSQDVRKAAEAVVHALFDLNAGEFTMMLHVLPKTFQDGAMKVLQNRIKVNGETSPNSQSGGYITARIGMSPAGTVVSPRASSTGYAEVVSPRDSEDLNSDNLNQQEIEANFSQITSNIHKLRLDSSAQDQDDYVPPAKPLISSNHTAPRNSFGAGDARGSYGDNKGSYGTSGNGFGSYSASGDNRGSYGASSDGRGSYAASGDGRGSYGSGNAPPLYMPTSVCYPPPFKSSPQATNERNSSSSSSNKNPFSPVIYNDVMKSAVFDDELDDNNDGGSGSGEIFLQFADGLSTNTLRKSTLLELRRALRSNDQQLIITNQTKNCENKFLTLLQEVLECLKDNDGETRLISHNVLKEMMMRFPSSFFSDSLDSIIFMILEAHKDIDSEVVRAADECATTLSLTQNPKLCIEILTPSICHSTYPTLQAVIKMMTEILKRAQLSDLNNRIIAELVPGLIRGYDSSESSVRKAAVFCLVAMHQVIGEEELHKHLQSLSGCKMKLLQLYIKRAQPTA